MPQAGNDGNTLLLCHFEDTDTATGSPGMDDVSHAGNGGSTHGTATVEGTGQIDTAQYKFGSSSLLLDGNSDYIHFADNNDWDRGTGAFTLECWCRPAAVADIQGLIEIYPDNTQYMRVYITADPFVRVELKSTSADDVDMYATGGGYIAAETWYHVAFIRGWGGVANQFAVTINGTVGNTSTVAGNWDDLGASFTIGLWQQTTKYFGGHIDEVRFSNIARWTEEFTPPVYPYGKPKINQVEMPAKVQGVSVAYIGRLNG